MDHIGAGLAAIGVIGPGIGIGILAGLSSQAIGIVLNMNKKLGALKNSRLVLCGVGPKLMELIKITRLDRVLTLKPTQKESIATINGY